MIHNQYYTRNKSFSAKSPDAKKSKKDKETVPVVAMVTGDKGNPYYAEELRKAAEDAKKGMGKMDLKAEKPADKGKKGTFY